MIKYCILLSFLLFGSSTTKDKVIGKWRLTEVEGERSKGWDIYPPLSSNLTIPLSQIM